MGKRFYRGATWIVRHFGRRYTTTWEVPFDGEPCVFVGNHAGLWGPVDMVSSFPLRDEVYPWFNEAVMEKELVPAYVRQDYWWKPGCRLEPLYNATLPYIASWILPPILRSVPGVPVYHDSRVMITMKKSLELLKQGKHLLIFPEQPSGYRSHHMWINTGFMNIAPLYKRRTGNDLKFWPVHIDHRKRRFIVSAPVKMDPERTLEDQLKELEDALAYGLRGGKTTDVKD